MAAFMLDALPFNAAFQSALSNDIVIKHPELWSGVQFHIMDDPICCELSVISVATGTSMKFYRHELFSSFKATLELSFNRIMHAQMLKRLSESSVQPTHATSSLVCLLAGYVA